MKIEIKRVTAAELREVARRFEGASSGRGLRADRYAFSILFTHRETGERRCEIYLSTEKKFDLVETLSHEAAHCFGFKHK